MQMFKIGDFSKICQVTRQTLRHWDAIDLLKPAYVEPYNQYRYYTVEQIADVNRILALQLLGLTLNEIQAVFAAQSKNLSEDAMRAKYEDKIRHLDSMIERYQFQREMLEVRLRNIETDRPFTHDITLKPTEPLTVYTCRENFSDIGAMSAAILRAYQFQMAESRLAVSISHVSAIEETDLDVEVGFLILGSDSKPQSHQVLELEKRIVCDGDEVVCTVFHGSWLHGVEIYNEVGRWLAAHNYMLQGPWREIYHRIDESGAAGKRSITEFQFPVMKA